MRTKNLTPLILLCSLVGGLRAGAQSPPAAEGQRNSAAGATAAPSSRKTAPPTPTDRTPTNREEIIERMIARERAEVEIIAQYSPIIETYIQELRPDPRLGMVPKSDFYFLGQADFGRRLKVHSLIERSSKGSLMWSFEPAGFLQMIFIDRGEFDKGHYRFEYEKREFLGEVRCHVFRISPVPKARGARFLGRIWVEDQNLTIVRINGTCRRPIFVQTIRRRILPGLRFTAHQRQVWKTMHAPWNCSRNLHALRIWARPDCSLLNCNRSQKH